uniref:Lysosomal cobalamin transporter n=1 Tax=Globodera pallida TaxID=36090 RepID=A0A183C3F5_GLOPA
MFGQIHNKRASEYTFAGGKSRVRHSEENCCCRAKQKQDADGQESLTTSPRAQTLPEQLKLFALMACCFCCCPILRCVFWFCAFEAFLSLYLWYSVLSDLIRTFNSSTELKDVLLLVVLTGWLVTLGVSTVSLVISKRKKDYQFVWPRLVQQSGLLVLGFLLALLLLIYFAGGAYRINSCLISFYESAFSDPLDREARQDAHESLRLHFLVLIPLDFLHICYMASALCATKKYYKELQMETLGRPFQVGWTKAF